MKKWDEDVLMLKNQVVCGSDVIFVLNLREEFENNRVEIDKAKQRLKVQNKYTFYRSNN